MLPRHQLWMVSVTTGKLATPSEHNTDTSEALAPNTGRSEELHGHEDVCAGDTKKISNEKITNNSKNYNHFQFSSSTIHYFTIHISCFISDYIHVV